MDRENILEKCRELRRLRQFEAAFAHIQGAVDAGDSDLNDLVWQHSPVFWSDISAGICKLTRRRAEDGPFLREVWKDEAFVHQFHRHAPPLPASDAELNRILDQELTSILSESHALHWIVRDAQRRPWGLLSLCEISRVHRRAEVLCGILPGAPVGLTAAAMLMLFVFFFDAMKFNKLISLVYPENTQSLKSTMHLGFRTEGRLQSHALDPRTGGFSDIIQFGLLKADAFRDENKRLMRRLLTPRSIT